jgi:hypothetical protein
VSIEPVRTIDVAERRARMARRHLLLPDTRATAATAVADALVALHATDPATVYLSIAARAEGVSREHVAAALHEERTLRKVLCMRRTLFALPLDVVPVAAAACTRAVAVKERQSLVKHLGWAGVEDPGAFVDAAVEDTAAALAALGDVTAAELVEAVPALRQEVDPAPGKPYGGPGRITTRVLILVAASGRAIRGRPMGGLTSSLTRWEAAPPGMAEEMQRLDDGDAQAELVGRWLRAFGPATDADVAWWAGITLGRARAALQKCDAVPVDVDGAIAYVLPDDVDPVAPVEPWIALLPALDPTPMGWSSREWYLGSHKAAVFDANGNVGPTVWCDGRIVGGWAQRSDGTIVWRLLEDAGKRADAAIAERAASLQDWLGDVRVTPRFRTPLERDLSA